MGRWKPCMLHPNSLFAVVPPHFIQKSCAAATWVIEAASTVMEGVRSPI